MRAHRVMTASNNHHGTAEFRQHVQHVGARQSAECIAEAHWIVGEITPEIGFVSLALTELRRIGQSKRRRQRGAHAFVRGEGGALIQHCGAARIDAGRRIAQNQPPDALRIFFGKTQRLGRCGRNGNEVKRRRKRKRGSSTSISLVNSCRTFSESPAPRWSYRSTRKCSASRSTTPSQELSVPPSSCSSTTDRPAPASA